LASLVHLRAWNYRLLSDPAPTVSASVAPSLEPLGARPSSFRAALKQPLANRPPPRRETASLNVRHSGPIFCLSTRCSDRAGSHSESSARVHSTPTIQKRGHVKRRSDFCSAYTGGGRCAVEGLISGRHTRRASCCP